VTIVRSGGVAGFSDTVVVQEDGSVRATTRTGSVSCTLDAAGLRTITEGAAAVEPTDTPSTPATEGADALSVVLRSGTGGLSVDDPRLAGVAEDVSQVLADVTGPVGERLLCH
jgi:hypothetical protein